MAGTVPPLVIPIQLDGKSALDALRRLEAAGKESTDKTHEGSKHAQKGLEDMGGAAKEAGSALTDLLGVQAGFGMIGQAVGVITDRMKEAADYTKKTVEEFATLREAIKQIAALQGKTPTNEFTVEQAKLSAEGGGILTPMEMAKGQQAFLQYGSGYVSKEGKPGTGRVEQSTVNTILPKLLAYAKSRGVPADVASRLVANIIQAMPPGSKPEEYEDLFMKVMAIAETSKGSAATTVAQVAPLLAEGIGKGMAFGEQGPEAILSATRLAAVESERGPEESFTYSRALVQELNKIHHKEGAEAELGITPGSSPEEKVRAIKKTADAKGVSVEDLLHSYVHDPIRGTGAMLTAVNAGIGEGKVPGMFDTMKTASAAASRADIEPWMTKYKAEGQGASEFTEAQLARARTENAALWAGVEHAKETAKGELTAEVDTQGRNVFQRTEWKDLVRGTVGRAATGLGRDEGIITKRAMTDLESQLTPGQIAQARKETTGMATGTMGTDSAAYLKRLVELAEMNHRAPMAAPPPKPTARP
jgi:hypothetical protein